MKSYGNFAGQVDFAYRWSCNGKGPVCRLVSSVLPNFAQFHSVSDFYLSQSTTKTRALLPVLIVDTVVKDSHKSDSRELCPVSSWPQLNSSKQLKMNAWTHLLQFFFFYKIKIVLQSTIERISKQKNPQWSWYEIHYLLHLEFILYAQLSSVPCCNGSSVSSYNQAFTAPNCSQYQCLKPL